MKHQKIIALDGDGVLVHYNAIFPVVYKKAFGKELPQQIPGAYHAANEYGLAFTKGTQEHEEFFANFGEEEWESFPLIEGAKEACLQLQSAGYTLVVVTSMPLRFREARARNLQRHGLPISEVYATGRSNDDNPKKAVIDQLQPVAFVDDLAHNFRGLSPSVHKALVNHHQFDSPNRSLDLSIADSKHDCLHSFAQWWVSADRDLNQRSGIGAQHLEGL
ncbi:hypothetical protein LC612_31430 [Nostoc sp. CHAB 5834]|nr:hypothetical protein [Nostoc sp. CHAB 5834]